MTRADARALVIRPLWLWLRYWPQLAACYLLGLLVRRATIELAAWAGHDNDWWASLIMPMAGLARLGSYVAMFLVLRPALPALTRPDRRDVGRIDIFANVIVPFFAIYIAWHLYREDWLAFETRALDYRLDDAFVAGYSGQHVTDLSPGSLPVGWSTWILIAAALGCRWALSKIQDRLPAWMIVVRIYADALWVFLVLSFSANQGLTLLINPAQWISERRVMVWFGSVRDGLMSHFQPLQSAWDATMWFLRTTLGGVAVPLMWLAIAGIVYGVGVTGGWRGAVTRMAGDRAGGLLDRSSSARTRLRARWRRLPTYVREKSTEHADARLGRFKPITDAARVILHAGIPALAVYVLAYVILAWLDRTGSFYGIALGDGYLFRGMAWVLGPHPIAFWNAYSPALALASHLIIEPLRICLVASTFAYCVAHAKRLSPAAPVTPAAGQ